MIIEATIITIITIETIMTARKVLPALNVGNRVITQEIAALDQKKPTLIMRMKANTKQNLQKKKIAKYM